MAEWQSGPYRVLGHGHVRSTARYIYLDDADAIAGNQIIGDVIASYLGKGLP